MHSLRRESAICTSTKRPFSAHGDRGRFGGTDEGARRRRRRASCTPSLTGQSTIPEARNVIGEHYSADRATTRSQPEVEAPPNEGAASLEPVHPVEFGDMRCAEKARDGHDQIFGITGASTVKPPGRREDPPAWSSPVATQERTMRSKSLTFSVTTARPPALACRRNSSSDTSASSGTSAAAQTS